MPQRFPYAMRDGGDVANGDAGRVADGAEDGGGGGDEGGLADALRSEGPLGLGVLNEAHVDLRHVADCRDQVVVQVFGAAWDVLLHQREAEPLRNAAVDLALDERRIDRAADVMRGEDAQHLRRGE